MIRFIKNVLQKTKNESVLGIPNFEIGDYLAFGACDLEFPAES
jgi:hypothetical protein